MSIENIVKRLRESRVQEFRGSSTVYDFRIPWRQCTVIEYSEEYEYDPTYMPYAAEIMKEASSDFNEADIAQYTKDDYRTSDCNIEKMTMSFNKDSDCIISVQTSHELDEDQITGLIAYLTGQMSDGWGEGFEQREIDSWVESDYEDGEVRYTVYGQFWWNSKRPPWDIDFIGKRSMRDIEEATDSEYQNLKKSFSRSASFSDEDRESGNIRDLTDELDKKGVSYSVYKNKTDKGCTIFYED